MKRRSHLYIFLTVSLIINLQIISGYTVTAGTEGGVGNREALQIQMFSLSYTDAYSSYERWINVMAAMHEPGRYNESVNAEDDALIKDYLRIMSQK